jgi:hypothetical protein
LGFICACVFKPIFCERGFSFLDYFACLTIDYVSGTAGKDGNAKLCEAQGFR